MYSLGQMQQNLLFNKSGNPAIIPNLYTIELNNLLAKPDLAPQVIISNQ
jgi:hypothetical protein